MPITPIDPTASLRSSPASPSAVTGPEFQVAPVAPETTSATEGAGFGAVLGKSLSSLSATQTEAAQAA